jgi:hypothetical protein
MPKERLASTSNFKNRVDHVDDEHTYVTLMDRLTWATRPDLAGPQRAGSSTAPPPPPNRTVSHRLLSYTIPLCFKKIELSYKETMKRFTSRSLGWVWDGDDDEWCDGSLKHAWTDLANPARIHVRGNGRNNFRVGL